MKDTSEAQGETGSLYSVVEWLFLPCGWDGAVGCKRKRIAFWMIDMGARQTSVIYFLVLWRVVCGWQELRERLK